MKKILAKLFKLKKGMESVKKSADNPFFSSKYADLNAHLDVIEPLLIEENLIMLQPCEVRADGKQVVKTIITDIDSDESVTSEMELLLEKKDMQKLGSAVTYARRYTLGSLLSMKAEDDDGNGASQDDKKVLNKKKKFKKKPSADEDEF